MAKRDYEASPISDGLGLRKIILGLADDLQAMRKGEISPQDGIARATVAKQLFNGVRLYLQAMRTMEGTAITVNDTTKQIDSKTACYDGWTRWEGGECPVTGTVDVRLRKGTVFYGEDPTSIDWKHVNRAFDIIAYRLCR